MPSAKEALWLSCREKSCCSHYSVMPTTADLWRISRSLELPPWAFTRYTDAPPEQPGAFALDDTGPRFQIVLAKRAGVDPPAPCVLLLRLPDGHAQCALGAERPVVCRSYPATLVRGVVCVGEHGGCTCRAWTEVSLDQDAETLLMRLDRDRREHAELVAEWNSVVRRDSTNRSFPELCDHLMAAFAGRHPEV